MFNLVFSVDEVSTVLLNRLVSGVQVVLLVRVNASSKRFIIYLIFFAHSHRRKTNVKCTRYYGERFNGQFEFRQWEDDFESVIDDSSGLLLFVDPRDVMNKPRLLFHENQYYRMFGDEKPKSDKPLTEWTEKLAPSQVKLVDFLQMLDYHKQKSIRRIAILVSCWDVVKNETNPENWAKIHVPLLYQYLKANDKLFEVKFFGISSQGGSYELDKSKLQQMEPLDRIKVTDGLSNSNNILSPILWLTDEH